MLFCLLSYNHNLPARFDISPCKEAYHFCSQINENNDRHHFNQHCNLAIRFAPM